MVCGASATYAVGAQLRLRYAIDAWLVQCDTNATQPGYLVSGTVQILTSWDPENHNAANQWWVVTQHISETKMGRCNNLCQIVTIQMFFDLRPHLVKGCDRKKNRLESTKDCIGYNIYLWLPLDKRRFNPIQILIGSLYYSFQDSQQ